MCNIEAPKDLIRKLLVLNPKERLTVVEALEHPFFNVKVNIYLILVLIHYCENEMIEFLFFYKCRCLIKTLHQLRELSV